MKLFFWKDKTGRGFTNQFNLLSLPDEYNDDDESLFDWACTAEEGDEWETHADFYICIKEDDEPIYDVLSPDGIALYNNGYYYTQKEAAEAAKEWVKRFELQGYKPGVKTLTVQVNGEPVTMDVSDHNIPYDEILEYCTIVEYNNECDCTGFIKVHEFLSNIITSNQNQ